MTKLQTILYNLFPFLELICVIVGITQYNKLKKSYWKWFVLYLIVIVSFELFNKFGLNLFSPFRRFLYDFIVIPIEFFFFYWLYAKKSLKLEKLFWISCTTYSIFYIIHLFNLDKIRYVSSMTYTVGVFLLAIMVYLEFIKQIKSEEILNFKSNKMFYINIAVMLFYIGTLPFFAFDKYLYENEKEIWNNYYTFFLLSVNIMYLLFTASFIWGKQKP